VKSKKQIIAIGGGGFTHNEDRDLDQFFADKISKENSSIGFLPTASNDDTKKTELFYKRFQNTNFKVSHFNLVSGVKGFERWLSSLNAIYVGGGNTKFMLELWKKNNLFETFKEVYNSGVILSGVSAGAACWFDCFLTDSDGPDFKPLSGIGLISGSFTPHYSDTKRAHKYSENIKNKTLPSGIAIDDGVAVLFIDGKPTEVYSSRESHNAYFVDQNKQLNLKEYIKVNNE
jgi:peptidase E